MTYENKINLIQLPKNNLTVIDLFSGGGLGAVGIIKAGYEIVYAIDNNKYAVQTYNKNIGNHCNLIDIRKLSIDSLPECDVLMGSPVCKSFSFAGNNLGFKDSKYGDLSYYYLEILKKKKPKAFVFENVKGMISKKHITYFNELINAFKELGYNINYKIVNAYEWGVPQLRERLIIVGIRNDISGLFEFPESLKERDRLNIRQAIADLPQPKKVMNSKKDVYFINNKDSYVFNHIGYGIRNDEKPYVNKIPSGGNWRSLTNEDAKLFLGKAFYSGGGKTGFLRKVDVNKPSYTITASMNGKNNAQILDSKDLLDCVHNLEIKNQDRYYEAGYSPRYISRNRQKQWEEPSFTIVSEARQLPLYPEPINYDIRKVKDCDIAPPRRFTVRECLRLQSIPDWFIIDDEISLPKQYEIVGNGIPALITYKIFNSLLEILK